MKIMATSHDVRPTQNLAGAVSRRAALRGIGGWRVAIAVGSAARSHTGAAADRDPPGARG
jgi:hypothetical protein